MGIEFLFIKPYLYFNKFFLMHNTVKYKIMNVNAIIME